MESKDELKEIDIKNRTCYYFEDIITDWDIDFSDILVDEKLYKEKHENTLIYGILYKITAVVKPLRFRFDKIDGFFRVRSGETRHVVLFDYGLFGKIYDRIENLKKWYYRKYKS